MIKDVIITEIKNNVYNLQILEDGFLIFTEINMILPKEYKEKQTVPIPVIKFFQKNYNYQFDNTSFYVKYLEQGKHVCFRTIC